MITNLNSSNFHLPYNRNLVVRAKELRKNMTLAEKKLWYEYLRTCRLRILRQRPIDQFIVDFYCPQLKMVIEVDGESHFTEDGQVYDTARTNRLGAYGLKVVRFTNEQVLYDFESVCECLQCLMIDSSNSDLL